MEKTCSGCGETKPYSAYHKNKSKSDGISTCCKLCSNRYTETYRNKHPERPYYNNLKWKFGITREQYDEQLALQGGGCAICGSTEELCVDHCHKTNVVRGIVCRIHNAAMGAFGDDPATLRKAADYIEEHTMQKQKRKPGRKPGKATPRIHKKTREDLELQNWMLEADPSNPPIPLEQLESEFDQEWREFHTAEKSHDVFTRADALLVRPDESSKTVIMPAATYTREELQELVRIMKPNAKITFWFREG